MMVLTYQSSFDIPLPPSVEAQPFAEGWQVQNVQPPAAPSGRIRDVSYIERGNEFPMPTFVPNVGWNQIGPQEKHLRYSYQPVRTIIYGSSLIPLAETPPPLLKWPSAAPYRNVSYIEPGIEAVFVPPPPTITFALDNALLGYTRPRRDTTTEDLVMLLFNRFQPYGWELLHQTWKNQLKRDASYFDAGNAARLITFQPYGWEVLPQPWKQYRNKDVGYLEQGIEAVYSPTIIPLVWAGWDVVPVYRAGWRFRDLSYIEAGAEKPSPFTPWGHEQLSQVYKRILNRDVSYIELGNEAPISFRAYGWEVAPALIDRWLPYRPGAIQPLSNVEVVFVPPPSTITFGYEQTFVPLRRTLRVASGGDDGAEANLIAFHPAGTEVQLWQPPHPRPERAGSIQPVSNIEARLFGFQVYGWEVASLQPPHPRPEKAALIPAPLNLDALYIVWRNDGWEIQPPQPPRLRPRGSIQVIGDPGIESTFSQFKPHGWVIQPWQPPHPRPERSGAQNIGDLGTEAPTIRFRPYGWEVPSPQPPHPVIRLWGALAIGDIPFGKIIFPGHYPILFVQAPMCDMPDAAYGLMSAAPLYTFGTVSNVVFDQSCNCFDARGSSGTIHNPVIYAKGAFV